MPRGIGAKRIGHAAVTICAAFGLAIAVTPSASADVLINLPPTRVCLGHAFKVGVWYQAISGGSRAYRVAVYNPHRRLVLYKHGRAPAAYWKLWKVHARQVGRYHTVYHTRYGGRWHPYRAVTRARRC